MIKRAACAFALAVGWFAVPAFAEPSGVWTHPNGAYTFDLSSADARPLGPMDNSIAVFQLGPDAIPVRMCFVREPRSIPNSQSATQSSLNEGLAGIYGRAPLSPGALSITDLRSIERGSVTIFASRVEAAEAILHYRQFALASAQGATLHEINCGGPPPVTAAEEAVFNAFLDSIQFTQPR